ncbi:NAD(P)H-binding protein [Rhodoplanes sp. SY1]|uniref:NAD(P)H-binding protein n=1 Tax=Rhodoplanes sp. SY1 TaxID=3166646 RepID=UPI0038B69679
MRRAPQIDPYAITLGGAASDLGEGFGAADSRAIVFLQFLQLQFVLGRNCDDKDAQKCLINKGSIDWTIVRPGVLTNGPPTGRHEVLEQLFE